MRKINSWLAHCGRWLGWSWHVKEIAPWSAGYVETPAGMKKFLVSLTEEQWESVRKHEAEVYSARQKESA